MIAARTVLRASDRLPTALASNARYSKRRYIDEEEKRTEETALRHTAFQEFWVRASTVYGDKLTQTG